MKEKKRRLVIKVGTSTLTNEEGKSDLRTVEMLSRVLSDLHNRGNEIVLVSSGAIAVGANKMHLKEKPTELRLKQAAAAVGQCENMFLYDKFFGYYNKTVAQILFNAEDIAHEEKKENLTNTFETLLEQGIIPIVNENDSVSYTEIESEEKLFGDNDMLSAVVAVLCRADLLVILSDIDGFYDKDPRLYKNAKLIDRIGKIDESTYALAGGAGSRRGTGGMRTKLQAAELATSQQIKTLVTNGKNPEVLYDISEGKKVGTLFTGEGF
ncbi:MAG: glutamate 5-kinase [Lachnospiraceae bacterium]|nr:glutamate 5-kinase [Lachnospiraceae bacterium]